MKKEVLTKWEELAIKEHLRFHPKDEWIRLNARQNALKVDGKWIINETDEKAAV